MEIFKPEKRAAGAEKDLEKISEVLKNGFETLVVHGDYHQKGDKTVLRLRPDLDAMAGVHLMDLAGINYRALRFVPKGQEVLGAVHIDTGERPALTIEESGSIFFDHHGKAKEEPTSAAAIVYESLIKVGLLKKEAQLDNFTKFVTEVDNLSYPLNLRFFQDDWWRSLYGINKILSIGAITKFFKEGRDPRQAFTEEEMENIYVKNRQNQEVKLSRLCASSKKSVSQSIDGMVQAVRQMRAKGIKNENPELGTVLLNILEEVKDSKTGVKKQISRIPLGFTAVKAIGLETYILWNDASKSFFITSQRKDLSKIYPKIAASFPGTKLIRGTMIINPPSEDKPKESNFDNFLIALKLEP